MTRGSTSRGASTLFPVVLLVACGGHTSDAEGRGGAGNAPGAGGTANGYAASSGGTGAFSHGGSGDSRNGDGASSNDARGTGGSGGDATNAGGAPSSESGGASAGGSASGGSPLSPTLSIPKQQVWVGEVVRWVSYPGVDDPNGTPEHAVLVLNAAGSEDAGSIVFGSAPPPPPPKDPEAFYPPLDADGHDAAESLALMPYEGAPYSLFDVARLETRLSFRIDPFELWKAWCALQATCPEAVFTANMPGHAPNRDDLCAKNPSGASVCLCDQSTCRWNDTTILFWTIDLQLRNELLEGQISYGKSSPGGAHTLGIRLKRVQ